MDLEIVSLATNKALAAGKLMEALTSFDDALVSVDCLSVNKTNLHFSSDPQSLFFTYETQLRHSISQALNEYKKSLERIIVDKTSIKYV